ncbi:MAG TPA: cytochrome c oxidase subunit 3 [Chloroflexota bacterium]|nr:cytochrome c oxidase subunit 3 [Chloroflexota bacterium]
MAVATPRPAEAPRIPLQVGMMGMYIFLASEVMFFGTLFGSYFYFVGSHPLGWPPSGTLPVNFWPLPTINTAILLTSGVTCHFGLEALRHERPGGVFAAALVFIGAALMVLFGVFAYRDGSTFEAVLGIGAGAVGMVTLLPMLGLGPFKGRRIFYGLWISTIVLGACFEAGQAYEFSHAHIKLAGLNEFGSAFFTMTGFHGAHVAGGIILLLLILFRAMKGHFNAQHDVAPSAVTLYWHFVDVVWLALYGILYLAVTA